MNDQLTMQQEIGYIMYAIGIQQIHLEFNERVAQWGGTDSYTAYDAALDIRKEHGAFTYEKDGEKILEEDMVHAAVTQFFNNEPISKNNNERKRDE